MSILSRLVLGSVLLVSALLTMLLVAFAWFPEYPVLLMSLGLGLVAVSLHAWMRYVMQPVFEMMRAMSGTVLSYQDKDFSFGLHWERNDEMRDLVDAHNALGQVLREQRLDLVQRELLLDSMLQNTPVAMLLLGARGHIVFANLSARQLLHHGRKLEGMSLVELLAQVTPALSEALARGGDGLFSAQVGEASQGNEQTLQGEDEIYHLSRRHFILNGSDHELLLIRHLTKELRRQEVQTWKKVIRVISHELNNSLAPVASLAHSAKALIAREQYQRLPEILQTVEERAEHLKLFIDGYACFAKLPTPRKEPIAWAHFLASLQTQVSFQLLGSIPERPCDFDHAQMEQALINLLKNAHESGSDAQAVSVEIKVIADYIRIDVGDRGQGMSETVMAHALVPFYSTKRHGTGLGLALAREIVEAHGGRISLSNREGGGLVVSLMLPQA